MVGTNETRWLVLVHQVPPKPDYLRVKVWRRLQRLGAVALKNSVYVLPSTDQAREDLQWVLGEILQDGGEGTICDARFLDGLTDGQVESMFRAARDGEYAQLAGEARASLAPLSRSSGLDREERAAVEAACARLKRRFAETAAVDYFRAPGRAVAEGLLAALEARLRSSSGAPGRSPGSRQRARRPEGRTWVTRKGVHVDRIASAWLIRRFIDPKAAFKFVAGRGYRPRPGELRFDMFEAEYTHRGDRCTFEVLLGEFGIKEPALDQVARIVHDIDLKDAKFALPETPGIGRLMTGIAAAHKDDDTRVARGAELFDLLFDGLRRARP